MPVQCTCVRCGAVFFRPPSAAVTARFCSLDCARNGIVRDCDYCNAVFITQPSRLKRGEGRFCSRRCASFGIAAPLSKRKPQGDDPAHRRWSTAVKERDGFVCQGCKLQPPVRLHAHHIIPWREQPELALTVSNGITLCPACHKRAHLDHGDYEHLRRRTTRQCVVCGNSFTRVSSKVGLTCGRACGAINGGRTNKAHRNAANRAKE